MTSEHKHCPGCGAVVPSGGRGMGKGFCSNPCRKRFHNRNYAEGGPMVAMVKAWHLTRHAPAGSREAEICRFARGQLTQMAQHYIERDAREGRPSAVEYVAGLMDCGTLWVDRIKG
jgi:predicted nucleic acid-binding Zn ribbon protein